MGAYLSLGCLFVEIQGREKGKQSIRSKSAYSSSQESVTRGRRRNFQQQRRGYFRFSVWCITQMRYTKYSRQQAGMDFLATLINEQFLF